MDDFEGADHVNSHGVALRIQHTNGRGTFFEADYALTAQLGLHTVRESIGWRSSVCVEGRLDVARLQHMADAAQRQGVQVIWTLHYYGLPAGVDFYAPDFAQRFAHYCDQVARALSKIGLAFTR